MCDCKNGTEAKFRRWFTGELTRRGRWWTRVEAARGGHIGFPDLCVLDGADGSGLMRPIELKVGDIKQDRVRVLAKKMLKAGLRPAQINWWLEFEQAGGTGMIVVGVHSCNDGRWLVYWTRGYRALEAKSGLAIGHKDGWQDLNMDDV